MITKRNSQVGNVNDSISVAMRCSSYHRKTDYHQNSNIPVNALVLYCVLKSL